MSQITLPPLPIHPDSVGGMAWADMEKQSIEHYARQAIELDRQQRGEPVAWHSKQYGVVWMAIKPGSLVAGTQWFIQGRQEPVAEVVSPVSLVWHIATSELEHGTVFYTAPQPAALAQLLLDMIDTLCTGLEWNIENHPEVMNECDAEALQEARALLARHGAEQPAGILAVAEQMYRALCEESAAYEPPIHHVKAAVDAYLAWKNGVPVAARPTVFRVSGLRGGGR